MNSGRILLGLALIAFCCITFSHCITCYICRDKADCKKPSKSLCSPFLANNTRSYLDVFYKGVNPNDTSTSYRCFQDYLKLSMGEYQYKGCIYSNIPGCKLQLRDHYAGSSNTRKCSECNNKDKCNPAARADINALTVCAAVVAAAIGKYVWSAA